LDFDNDNKEIDILAREEGKSKKFYCFRMTLLAITFASEFYHLWSDLFYTFSMSHYNWFFALLLLILVWLPLTFSIYYIQFRTNKFDDTFKDYITHLYVYPGTAILRKFGKIITAILFHFII
jgi:hypothetical protein